MSIALLALLGLGLLALTTEIFGSDDSEEDDILDEPELDGPDDETPPDPVDPEEPEVPEEPEGVLDTGASVVEDSGVVTVELGEDETGTLAYVYYVDTEDAGNGLAEYHEARLYLVPEGSEIPEGENGDFDGSGLPLGFEIDDMETVLDLQLLGTWDLGEIQPTDTEPYFTSTLVDPPEIQTDDPVAYYRIDANADGDDIVNIVEQDDPPTTEPGFVTVTHEVDGARETYMLNGGGITFDDDDDLITVDGPSEITIRSGDGDDTISGINGAAYGEGGDDTLFNDPSGGASSLYGGAGNDMIVAWNPGTLAFGGAGDDDLSMFDGAAGYGQDGNDVLVIGQGGGTAHGGAGDDVLRASAGLATPATAQMTGGGGSDTFSLSPTDPSVAATSGGVTITDFDPSQDVLQIENAEAILDVRTSLAPGGNTLVEVDVEAPDGTSGLRIETVQFLLNGAPAVTEANFVLI